MRRLPLLIARVVGYVVLAAIGCVGAMGSVWALTVSFLAVLFLTPLGWIAIWRGKRDGRRPWCNLSYTEPAVAAVAFLVGIQRGISITGSDAVSRGTPTSGIVALSGIAALMIAGIVTLTLILALGVAVLTANSQCRQSRPVALVSPAQSRPQRILVWLAILCLTMFLLVPICAVGIGLLVPLLARQKSPVTKKALTNDLIRQWQQAAAEQQPTVVSTDLPLGVRWETEPGVNTMFEGKVQLDVLLLSEGMFVALRRSSSFNGSQAGDEHLATSIGTTSLKLQPGEYDVLVRGRTIWLGVGNRGRIVVREGGLGTLTVQRDLSSSVKPFQDFNTTTGSAAQFVGSAAEEHFGFLVERPAARTHAMAIVGRPETGCRTGVRTARRRRRRHSHQHQCSVAARRHARAELPLTRRAGRRLGQIGRTRCGTRHVSPGADPAGNADHPPPDTGNAG